MTDSNPPEKTPLKPINRWGVPTWVAAAIILIYATVLLCMDIEPLNLVRDLYDELGLMLWLLPLLLWLGITGWGLWRDRRQAIWRTLRCGVIIVGITIPLAAMAAPILWVASMAISVQRSKAELSRDADIPAIRQWAQQYKPDDKDFVLNSGAVAVHQDNLPPCIKKFEPLAGVFFNPTTKEVKIARGSGHGHWGITITPTEVRSFDSE